MEKTIFVPKERDKFVPKEWYYVGHCGLGLPGGFVYYANLSGSLPDGMREVRRIKMGWAGNSFHVRGIEFDNGECFGKGMIDLANTTALSN